jgi:TRAP-type C4-dicarboxylate transport system permease small subunit
METQATQRQKVAQTHRFLLITEKYVNKLSLWLNWIAGGGLVLMLALTVGDIVGIKIFSAPIPGAIEFVAFLGVVVIGFAIAFTQSIHGHIRVDFIVLKFPPRLAAVVDVIMLILGMSLFILLAWRSFDYAYILQRSGEVSMTQKLPFYPFVYGMALCFAVTFLVLAVEFIKSVFKVGKTWNR